MSCLQPSCLLRTPPLSFPPLLCHFHALNARGISEPEEFRLARVEKEELKSLPNHKLPSAHCDVYNPPCLCREQDTAAKNGGGRRGDRAGRQSCVLAREVGTKAARIGAGFCGSKGLLKYMQCSFD